MLTIHEYYHLTYLHRTMAHIRTFFSTHSRLSDSQYDGQNLSFGNSNQVVYDIDGKFPYTYYENKPILYDIDGKHRYK